jgi:hypothetical protein
METEIKEQKELVLKRVPPGDRWVFANATKSSLVYQSLTDALEAWYQENNDTQFYMDARKGTVEIVTSVKVEKPTKKFSLYGED